MGWYQKKLLVFCFFAVIGVAVYFNSFNNSFRYDDQLYITSNTNIRTLNNVPAFFTNPRTIAGNPYEAGHYRPLVVLSYAVNYAIGGLKPAGYHLVNLAFHVGAAFLVFLIVKAMLGSTSEARSKTQEVRSEQTEARSKKQDAGEQIPLGPPLLKGGNIMAGPSFIKVGWGGGVFFAALASGLIFLVHPFNSEAINYLTARSSVMSGFFYLLGFWCWVKYRSKKQEARSHTEEARSKKLEVRENLASDFLPLDSNLLPLTSYFYIGSLFAFVAGMLSKEVVITLPIAMWLYDFYFLEKRRKFSLRTYLQYLPFLLIVLIPYIIIRFFSYGGVLPHFKRDFITQIFTVVPVLVKHYQMFIWPGGLTLVHSVPIFSGMTLSVLLSLVLLVIYIGVAVYLARSKNPTGRMASFFMFWFIIVLLPIIVFPLNAIFQENRGYLAIISFAVLFGVIAVELSRRIFSYKNSYKPLMVFMAVVLIIYSTATIHRNTVWGDDLRFWKDVTEKSPGLGVGYAILSMEYKKKGENFLSMDTLQKGLDVDPANFHLRFNLGQMYQMMGKIDEAIVEYEKALAIDSRHALLWNDLAILYAQKGDLGRAELSIRKAVTGWGNMPGLQYTFGVILGGQGKFKEAEEAFRRVVIASPGFVQARYELGDTLEKLGRSDEAIEQYREIIAYTPSDADSGALSRNKDKQVVEMIKSNARQRLARMRISE